MGVINFDSNVSFFLGIRVDGGEWLWEITSGTGMHLIDLLVEEFRIGDLACKVSFVPCDSSTLLVVLNAGNHGSVPRSLGIAGVISKEPVCDGLPLQGFGPAFTSTGKLLWGRHDSRHSTVFSCYEEWDKKQARGKLLCTFSCSRARADHFFIKELDSPVRDEFPFQYAGMEQDAGIGPGNEVEVRFILNLRRFAPEHVPNPWNVPLFAVESEADSQKEALRRNHNALALDLDNIAGQSMGKYTQMPAVELPRKSWAAGFYAGLELARGNTFSPYGMMKHPFTNFCRVYSHNPYDWWQEGEGGTFARTTFGTVLYAPELVKDHIRNVLDCQDESGRLPFCVNQNGVHDITSERSDMEKIPDFRELWRAFTATPEVVWQIWNVYLWTGDRDFLECGYAAGRRNHEWWLRNRDKDGDGLCCWEGVIETMRDNMPPIPTWRAIGLQHQEALDLNCYLLVQERSLAGMAAELGRKQEAAGYTQMARRRSCLMNKHMWDEEDKCYYGIDESDKSKKARVRDISTLLPLWACLAPSDRARCLVDLCRDTNEFKTDFPVPTLALSSPEFTPGEGWYGATWTWFNWLVILGLKNYGCYKMASDLTYKTLEMEFNSLEHTSHFREYYNSNTGGGIGLYDYEWSILCAPMIIQVFFGIEPQPSGLEILPSLPENWQELHLSNLHVRNGTVAVTIEKDSRAAGTRAELNGKACPLHKSRGVSIGWDRIGPETEVRIVQPADMEEGGQ